MKNATRKSVKSLVLLAGFLASALFANAPAQADDVPFVVDAIAKAQEAPTSEGKWQITANVTISSEAEPKMIANGPIVATSDNSLGGTLPLTIGDDANATNSLVLEVKSDGNVGIQRLIAGKPFLGREMQSFDALQSGEKLWKRVRWNGASRIIYVTFSSALVKNKPKIRVPGASPTPPKIRVPKKEIGKRYKLTGRLVVTDASDGYGDNTVEITGVLLLTQRAQNRKLGQMQDRPLVTIIPQPLGKNASLPADQNIFLDHIFADPKTEYLQVRALIYDVDDVSANDPMNVGETRLRSLASLADGKEHNLPGDRDSENVEVYYTVTFVEDLY